MSDYLDEDDLDSFTEFCKCAHHGTPRTGVITEHFERLCSHAVRIRSHLLPRGVPEGMDMKRALSLSEGGESNNAALEKAYRDADRRREVRELRAENERLRGAIA